MEYTIKAAAEVFGVTTNSIRRWIREGKLSARTVDGKVLISKKSITDKQKADAAKRRERERVRRLAEVMGLTEVSTRWYLD